MKRRLSIETLSDRRMLTSLVGADTGEPVSHESPSIQTFEPRVVEVSSFGTAAVSERAVYLKYELKNVQITSLDVNASGNDESPPTVTIGNNFEEYKVTYTEYDSECNKGGNAETTWKVEKGEK